MNTIGERIKKKRIELKLTQQDICSLFSPPLKRSSVSKWENGMATPDINKLESIARKLKTTVNYLVSGSEKPLKKFETLEPVLTSPESKNNFIWVDVVEAHFSCGLGESIEFHFDTVTGQLPFPDDFFLKKQISPQNVKIIQAKGDSMGDLIKDGDCVGIDLSQTEIIDGKIYAVYFAGEGMIKQLFKEADGSIVLHSLNPNYKDRVVNEKNGSNFKVMGRQFWRAG